MPVAGGEQDTDPAHWRRMLAMEVMSIAQPDIGYIGGLSRLLRVAAMARRLGVRVTPHTANPSLLTIFGLHAMCILKNTYPYMEHSIEDMPWAEGLYDPAPAVTDGQIVPPAGPGWGVKVRDSWLQQAAYQRSDAAD
jgi:L-alanine-DL-glutamate epimerase-like enolase superfamily enzyme